MPLPVWAALLGIAVAKKVVVFTAAKVTCCRIFRSKEALGSVETHKFVPIQIYGFPRLYRKSQQLSVGQNWVCVSRA